MTEEERNNVTRGEPKKYFVNAVDAIEREVPDGVGYVLIAFTIQERGTLSFASNVRKDAAVSAMSKLSEMLVHEETRKLADVMNEAVEEEMQKMDEEDENDGEVK